MNRYLCVDARDRFVVRDGRPYLDERPHGGEAVRIDAETWAVRVSADFVETQAAETGGQIAEGLEFLSEPTLARVVALLRHRDNFRFDPADGSRLTFDEDGVVGKGERRSAVFPRIDPAVIGIVELAGEEKILLGRNAFRTSGFFSLIAGYVDPGESLEDAFAREVMEETGRRVTDVTYWGSQPWPPSGSLMIGFHALTEDVDATGQTDGELAETRWVGVDDVDDVPLPRSGSIAHEMIMDWISRHSTSGSS